MNKIKLTWKYDGKKAQDTLKVNDNMFRLLGALATNKNYEELYTTLRHILNKKRNETNDYDWDCLDKIEIVK